MVLNYKIKNNIQHRQQWELNYIHAKNMNHTHTHTSSKIEFGFPPTSAKVEPDLINKVGGAFHALQNQCQCNRNKTTIRANNTYIH